MQQERWKEIVAHIKDNFEVLGTDTYELPEATGPGSVEVVEFQGPMGRMKLEFTTQPLVLGKRTITSRRIGADVAVEYEYSDSEVTHKFKAFRFDPQQNDWVVLELPKEGGLF